MWLVGARTNQATMIATRVSVVTFQRLTEHVTHANLGITSHPPDRVFVLRAHKANSQKVVRERLALFAPVAATLRLSLPLNVARVRRVGPSLKRGRACVPIAKQADSQMVVRARRALLVNVVVTPRWGLPQPTTHISRLPCG